MKYYSIDYIYDGRNVHEYANDWRKEMLEKDRGITLTEVMETPIRKAEVVVSGGGSYQDNETEYEVTGLTGISDEEAKRQIGYDEGGWYGGDSDWQRLSEDKATYVHTSAFLD